MCSGLAIVGEPTVRVETGAARAEIMALSWDTEGTGREQTSLLRPGTAAGLRFRVGGQWLNGMDLPPRQSEIYPQPMGHPSSGASSREPSRAGYTSVTTASVQRRGGRQSIRLSIR